MYAYTYCAYSALFLSSSLSLPLSLLYRELEPAGAAGPRKLLFVLLHLLKPPWTAAASALTAGGPAASDDRLLHASLLPLLSPGQRAPPTPIMLLDASPNHPARALHARPCCSPLHTQSHASSSGPPVLPTARGPWCLCRPLALRPASNSDASVAPFPPLPRLLSVAPLLLPSCAAIGGERRAPSPLH